MTWFSQNWGSLLGAIGLVITCFTFWAAKSAKQAAQEMRDYFKREGILFHVAAAYHLSQEIETLLSLAAYQAAQVRSRDLVKELAYVIKRWETEHSASTLTAYVEARTQADSLAIRLQNSSKVVSNNEQTRLLNVMQQITNKLGEERAAAEARVNQ